MESNIKDLYQLCDVQEDLKNGDLLDEDPCSTPVEVLSEFLSALMARNYQSALHYCKLILLYEPENEVVQDFYPLIQRKIHLKDVDSESEESCDENMISESSTEYFTSPSAASANTSICSSLSSDDEDE